MRRSLRIAKRALLRWVLGALRRIAPVAVISPRLQLWLRRRFGSGLPPYPGEPPPLVLVSEAKAACRVLADDETFPVTLYRDRMTKVFGPFLLGLDFDDPDYAPQVALLRAAVEPDEPERIRHCAHDAARAAVAATSPPSLDVVTVLQAAMSRFVATYFGIPEVTSGPTLLQLNQQTASYVFSLELVSAHLEGEAVAAGRAIRAHLMQLIEHEIQQPSGSDTFVARTVAKRGTRGAGQLATTLGGTISGLLVPTSSQFLAVVDRLLDLPARDLEELHAIARRRRVAAANGLVDEDADQRLDGYVREASRFNPFPPGLQRFCRPDAPEEQRVLVTASGRRKTIPAGATVFALTNAVAFDPAFCGRPGAFAMARPASEYLLFGTGQHHCIGATERWPVAPTLMAELATAIFALPGIRRAPGACGELHTPRGARWPDSFHLTHDAGVVP